MVEEEQYCIDILTQISAMAKALQGLALGLLDEHMANCVVNAARQGGQEEQQKLKQASDAIARLVRCGTHHATVSEPAPVHSRLGTTPP